MNASDLVERLADRTGLSRKAARACLGIALEEIVRALADGDPVTLSGFGTFEVRQRGARPGRHPKTNAPLTLPAHRTVAFRPGTGLRRALASGEADDPAG